MSCSRRERVEDDDLVDPVEELRPEGLAQLVEQALLQVLVAQLLALGGEAEAMLADHAAADVAGHDHDRVLEVDRAALAVGEPTVVEDLQQGVEHVRVRLLDLVEEDDAVRAPADLLGELAALVVAHVAGRRPGETGHGVLLHVLAHVEADQRRLVVEEELGERARQLGLADARGAQEDERADRPLGVLEAGAGAADGFADRRHRALLADHAAVQVVLHGEQLVGLFLQHALHRDAGPLAHQLGDVVGVHGGVGDALVGEPGVLGRDEGLLDLVALLLELRRRARSPAPARPPRPRA